MSQLFFDLETIAEGVRPEHFGGMLFEKLLSYATNVDESIGLSSYSGYLNHYTISLPHRCNDTFRLAQEIAAYGNDLQDHFDISAVHPTEKELDPYAWQSLTGPFRFSDEAQALRTKAQRNPCIAKYWKALGIQLEPEALRDEPYLEPGDFGLSFPYIFMAHSDALSGKNFERTIRSFFSALPD